MDVSSITNLLPLLQNQLSDQTATGGVATQDSANSGAAQQVSTGQELPTKDASSAASAPSGASNVSLSPELQALLLQSQESSNAIGLLMGDGSSTTDPMLAAISGEDPTGGSDPLLGGSSPSGLSPDLQSLLAQLDGATPSDPLISGADSSSSDPFVSGLASTSDPQTQSALQAVMNQMMASSSANSTISDSNQALLDLMSGLTDTTLA